MCIYEHSKRTLRLEEEGLRRMQAILAARRQNNTANQSLQRMQETSVALQTVGQDLLQDIRMLQEVQTYELETAAVGRATMVADRARLRLQEGLILCDYQSQIVAHTSHFEETLAAANDVKSGKGVTDSSFAGLIKRTDTDSFTEWNFPAAKRNQPVHWQPLHIPHDTPEASVHINIRVVTDGGLLRGTQLLDPLLSLADHEGMCHGSTVVLFVPPKLKAGEVPNKPGSTAIYTPHMHSQAWGSDIGRLEVDKSTAAGVLIDRIARERQLMRTEVAAAAFFSGLLQLGPPHEPSCGGVGQGEVDEKVSHEQKSTCTYTHCHTYTYTYTHTKSKIRINIGRLRVPGGQRGEGACRLRDAAEDCHATPNPPARQGARSPYLICLEHTRISSNLYSPSRYSLPRRCCICQSLTRWCPA
jgi:hypothetical protein